MAGLMYITGAALIALSFIVYYGGRALGDEDNALLVLGAILSVLIGPAGAYLLWRGRQYAARADAPKTSSLAPNHMCCI